MDTRKVSDKGKSQAPSKSKGTDFLRKATQDVERQHRNKPEAALGNTSQPKDLKSKSGEYSTSRHSDAKLRIDQTFWQKPKLNDRRTSHSHQRPLNAQSSWQSLQRSFSAFDLNERSRNANQRRERPILAGGGDGDDSSSQQQGESNRKRQRQDDPQGSSDNTDAKSRLFQEAHRGARQALENESVRKYHESLKDPKFKDYGPK